MKSIAILAFLVGLKILGLVWFQVHRQALLGAFSYVGDDYPRHWTISWPAHPFVQMPIHDTRRYQLETEAGDADWAASLPNDGIIYVGQCQPFSISMFHQLRCLDILRKALSLVRSRNATMSELGASRAEFKLVGHCMNYLRSMAFCRSDTFLDPLKGTPIPNGYPDADVCFDWNVVYREALASHARCAS